MKTQEMMKHTPGPWIGFEMVDRKGLPAKVEYFIDQEDAERRERMVYQETGGNIELWIYPLAVIFAAPELLEALKEAVQDCRCNAFQRDSGHLVDCRAPQWLELIAKAEGRS